ncbi:MAG: hypothetical protein QM737_18750 [Ferruginibacter sp.]
MGGQPGRWNSKSTPDGNCHVSRNFMKPLLYTWLLSIIIFGCKTKTKPLQLPSKEVVHSIVDSSNVIDNQVKSIWYKLIEACRQKNYKQFPNVSMDTISACSRVFPFHKFIESCSSEILTDLFFDRIKDTTNITIRDNRVISNYFSSYFLSKLIEYGDTFIIKRVQVDLRDTGPHVVAFDFVETKEGYKLYSCDVYGGPNCCR